MVQNMQIGVAKKTMEVAKNMIATGSDTDISDKVTGLSINEINKLRNS